MKNWNIWKRQSGGILAEILTVLNVRFTNNYCSMLYNDQPFRNSFYGLSKMLDAYNVESKGFRFIDKESALEQLKPPFVTNMSGTFVIVTKRSSEIVTFYLQRKLVNLSTIEFLRGWSGEALLLEKTEQSVEPDYRKHLVIEYAMTINHILLAFLLFLACPLCLFVSNPMTLGMSLVALLYIAGAMASLLLFLGQDKTRSNIYTKVCSLLTHGDCDAITNSDRSKFLTLYSWSTIGLSYFISGLCVIGFFPSLYGWTAIFNIVSLPFTIWSVYYQWHKHQWCPLCMMVQVIQWIVLLFNVTFCLFKPLLFQNVIMVSLLIIYLIPFTLLNAISWRYFNNENVDSIRFRLKNLKASEEVFATLLVQQPCYNVGLGDSGIVYGESNSPICITIMTNPYCRPCAQLHEKSQTLFTKLRKAIRVQYIFSSFSDELRISNQLLISACQNHPKDIVSILSYWFENGKVNQEDFARKYNADSTNPSVIEECQRHVLWREATGLDATPTILVNGYKMPFDYELEDLEPMDFDRLALLIEKLNKMFE